MLNFDPSNDFDVKQIALRQSLNDQDPAAIAREAQYRTQEEGKARDRELAQARFLTYLGPLRAFLDDPETENIEVNADGSVFVHRRGHAPLLDSAGRAIPVRAGNMPVDERKRLLWALANLQAGHSLDEHNSELACDMPIYDARVQANCPPIANWTMVIRVHNREGFALEKYVENGELSQLHYDYLVRALADELNIGIGGAVNSGKTSFMRALLKKKGELHPATRLLIIQDRKEIWPDGFANAAEIMAEVEQVYNESAGVQRRWTYGFAEALRSAMRVNQDCLVWGEIRDALSAFGLTNAANTGTKALMFTAHCKSARKLFRRVEQLTEQGGKLVNRGSIADTIEVAVFMHWDRETRRRRCAEVIRAHGVDEDTGTYDFEDILGSNDERISLGDG